jgi:hypothetical protein
MKFQPGDATDTALCVALKHEFLRCNDAFEEFASSATTMIIQGEGRLKSYKTYNAYARFIHHLYEFTLGAVARDRHDTEKLKYDLADRYVASEMQRALTRRREAILNGTASVWENQISAFPEKVPLSVAEGFRRARNIASGHVSVKRSNLNLSDFYQKNHKYLYILYFDIKSWWGHLGDEFPDLAEITAFSVMVKEDPPPPS